MAIVTAPMLSFDARGKIADTLVFSNWRGIPVVRRFVIPANPKTTAQVLTRDIFLALELRWKQGGPLMRAVWDRFATGQKFVGRNSYLGKNIAVLRGDADMADYIGSPGAKGGLPLTSLAVAAASLSLVVTLTAPTPPTGWSIEAVIATALLDQTPEATVGDVIAEGEDAVTPFDTVTLTGLTASVLYQVQGWIRWLKPDGSRAYGPSLTQSGTPAA